MADGGAGLRVIDVSVPPVPVVVGFAAMPGYADGAAVSGRVAYLADQDDGLAVFLECFFSDGFESGDNSAWSATVP